MSHRARRASSDKQSILKMFSHHMKAKVKSCHSVLPAPDCSNNKPAGLVGTPQRVKRLKTIKERNRIRGKSHVRFNHSHHHGQRTSNGKGCEGGCSHSVSHSKKEKPIAKPFHPRKPSIITEGRLTSIRGLFSHEVRSVDIERLVKAKETPIEKEVREGQANANTSCLHSPLIGETGEQEDQVAKTSKHFQARSLEKPSSAQAHDPTASQNENEPSSSKSLEATQKKHQPSREQTTAATAHTPQMISTPPNMNDLGPVIFSTPSPALNKDRNVSTDPSQHKESVSDEVVRRLAARLRQSLDSVPKRRQPPLLTECTEVLLKCLQEKHGSQLQHNLLKLRSSTREAHSSSTQSSTPFSCPGESEDRRVQAGRSGGNKSVKKGKYKSQKVHGFTDCLDDDSERSCGLDFYPSAERSESCKRRRKETWEVCSPQNHLTKLQTRHDTLSQWNITVQSPKTSPSFSMHQASTLDVTLDPGLFQPQKQPGRSVNIRSYSNALLEQWKHDPDLSFLFRDETTSRTQTSSGPLTRMKDWSPQHQEKIRQGPQVGGSSTASAFFPPEGFRYEPYYRFPHPSNTYSGPEWSGRTHNTPSDVRLSPSMDMTMPYLKYWPYT